MTALLTRIGAWYPGGEAWLDGRLGDALGGRATAVLAFRDDLLAGIAIDTPKGVQRHKLSTIYVAPWARRHGVGSVLFGWLNRYWLRSGATNVHVTLDAAKDDVRLFFERWGFSERVTVADRYGPGRAEKVLTWDPDVGETLAAYLH